MKGLIAVAVLVAIAAAGTTDGPDRPVDTPAVQVDSVDAPQPGNPQVAPELDADGLPPRIEYAGELSYACDKQGRAVEVVPDTTEARTAADRRCERLHISFDRMNWPDGIHVGT